MARRRLPDEPNSKLAVWSRRFALFSVAAALIAIIIVRAGLLEVLPGIVTFGGALAFGAIGILLALLSLITIWRQGLSGLGYSVTAIAVGGLLLAYPAYLGYKAYKLPPISDITTDILDPPGFDAIRRAAVARHQSGPICRPLCRRTAARSLSGSRDARTDGFAQDRL